MDPLTEGTQFPPPSPTISETSLIFERDVQEQYTFSNASGNTTSTTVSSVTVPLFKERSNSSVYMKKQHTRGSFPQPVMINNSRNRKTSRSNSSSSSQSQLFRSRSIDPSSPLSPSDFILSPSPASQRYHHHRHHTLENFVAPALDASCSIITDENTGINDVDLVYSRRPSTLGLNLALGGSKSYSTSSISLSEANSSSSGSGSGSNSSQKTITDETDMNFEPISDSDSRSNANLNVTTDSHSRVLRFYSYADLLSHEKTALPTSNSIPNVHRPSSAASTSSLPRSSIIPASPSQSQNNTTFLDPFNRKNLPSSATSDSLLSPQHIHYRKYSNSILSKSPHSRISSIGNKNKRNLSTDSSHSQESKQKPKSKANTNFHIESSGSDDYSSDEEDEIEEPTASIPYQSYQHHNLLREPNHLRITTSPSPLLKARSYSNTGNIGTNSPLLSCFNSSSNHTISSPMMVTSPVSTTTPISVSPSPFFSNKRRTYSNSNVLFNDDIPSSPLQKGKLSVLLRNKIKTNSKANTHSTDNTNVTSNSSKK
ncbi:hypothetical protein NCAS_0G02880 [Naumovozyma castellii]|uniref:Uncharacterized protein n=1 Tax=Naumovozyma castellii TaxID=27288 RepID=G0VIE0_NAUCA|nr:hypothetical protein NCAS_0G02880 [Naumovozyma castellii CBS 4309]CCC71175.1 hypothetical protein NCAS_0G02880 [Naumovozyma castellii CBS 4309]